MNSFEFPELIWIFSTLFGLGIGAYYDWKQRWIPDKIWIIQAIVGTTGTILWFQNSPSFFEIMLFVFNVLFGIIIFITIMITGSLGLGDAKLIFASGLSYPMLVYVLDPIFHLPEIVPALFSLLLNFLVVNLFVVVFFIVLNVRQIIAGRRPFDKKTGSRLEKTLLIVSGLYVSTASLSRRKYYYPGEIYSETGWTLYTPRIDLTLTDEELDIIEENEKNKMLNDISSNDKEFIWIRPQPPGIVLLFASYLMSLTVGTILGSIYDFLVFK